MDRIAQLIDHIVRDSTELQTLYVPPPQPPTGTIIDVVQGQDLQAVLDTVVGPAEIHLERGAIFVGNYVLRNRVEAGVVTLRTKGELPVPDPMKRPWISPSDAAAYAQLKAADTQYPALCCADGAHDYRIDAIGIMPNTQHPDRTYLEVGRGDMTALDQVPVRIGVDRCYLHGDLTVGGRRAIALQTGESSVTRCYIGGFFHSQDAQAIATWTGPGPFRIEGNFLESSGENYISGGADTRISGLIPSDLTFRGNFCYKPLSWQQQPQACVKNLFELKAMRRALIEANAFENCWTSGQSGSAIVLTLRNQDGGNPWNTIADVTVRYNAIGYATGFAFNLLGIDDLQPSTPSTNLNIHDNICWSAQSGVQIVAPFVPLAITHNTFIWALWRNLGFGGAPFPAGAFTFRDNVVSTTDYGITGDNRAPGTDTLNYYAPGGVYTSNLQEQPPAIAYPPGQVFAPASSCWPDGPSTGGAYPPGSDGKPMGADMAMLRSMLSWYTPAQTAGGFTRRAWRC